MTGRLEGKLALIAGGGGGIGGATARRFHAEGAGVGILDADREAAERTAASLPDGNGAVFALDADIGDPDAARAAVDRAASELGGLDIVVHSAAAREPTATVEELSIEDWNEAVRVNLTSMFLLCKFALPHLRARGGGVIVNIASQFGSVATAGRPAYHATKGAAIQLTRAIAVENAARNVRAVTVSPGAVETDRLLARHKTFEKVRERLVPNHPIGRLGQPEEIASAVLFAASEEASFMTGSDLIVDGGYTAV